jgi:hypothetical protein
MPQPIAYNTGSQTSGSIKLFGIEYAISSSIVSGSNNQRWFSSVNPGNGVVFVTSNYTQSFGTYQSSVPLFFTASDYTAAAITGAINGLPDRFGQVPFTTTSSAYAWVQNSGKYFMMNYEYPQIVTDKLVLNLDASFLASYPTTQSVWYDLSGYEYTGSINNGPTFNTNGYFEFDATDDEIVINDVGSQLQDFGITIDMKWNQNSIISSTTFGDIVCPAQLGIRDLGVGPTLYFQLRGSGVQLRWQRAGNDASISPSTPQEANKWGSYTGVLSSSGVTLYKNGNLIGTTSHSKTFLPWYNNTIKLARNAYNNVLDGSISDTKVYNKALTPTEILQNYYGGPIVTDGLVFAVDASNLVSYESGSTTTYSLTGSLTGSLVNGVGYNVNNGGNWVFDGIDDGISTPPGNSMITNSYSASLEVWFNIPPQGNDYACLFGTRVGDNISLNVRSGNNRLTVLINTVPGGNLNADTTTTIADNKWHHVVASYNNGTLNIYVDGINIWTDSTRSGQPLNINTDQYGIGDDFATSSREVNGLITIARIYNRALSADEVSQNFQSQRSRFGM